MIDDLEKMRAQIEELTKELRGKSFVYDGLTGMENHDFDDVINQALNSITDLIGVIEKYSEE